MLGLYFLLGMAHANRYALDILCCLLQNKGTFQ